MYLLIPTITLIALGVKATAFKIDPHGKTLAFDLQRRFPGATSLKKRDASGTVVAPVFNQPVALGGDYYMNFTIGTPGQPVAVTIDTGSSDFWVPATGGAACAHGCPLGSFDPTQSSSYIRTIPGGFDTSYVDGSSGTGDFGTDTVQLDGATLKNVTIGVASGGHITRPVAGLVGLSWATSEATAKRTGVHPTLLDALVEQGIISSHTFSLYLNDKSSSGNLLFGGIDTAKFQGELGIMEMELFQGVYQDYRVPLSGVSFSHANGASSTLSMGDSGSYQAVLDSGTAGIALPNDLANAIFTGLGLEYDSLGAVIPCEADVSGYTLSFTFGGPNGVTIATPLSEFIVPYNPIHPFATDSGDRGCLFGITPFSALAADPGCILIGDPVLRAAYVVYDLDNKQIAMAPAVLNATSSNIIAIAGSSAAALPTAASGPSAATSTFASAAATSTFAGAAVSATAFPSFTQSTGQDAELGIAVNQVIGPLYPATSVALVNTIPSATTVTGQHELTPAIPGWTPGPTAQGTAIPSGTSPAPTFNGMPSNGFSIVTTIAPSGTHNAAPIHIPNPKWVGSAILGVILLLTFACGSLLAF